MKEIQQLKTSNAELSSKKVNLFFLFKVSKFTVFLIYIFLNPFAPGDFAEKHVLKLVEWFSGHCHAIKS